MELQATWFQNPVDRTRSYDFARCIKKHCDEWRIELAKCDLQKRFRHEQFLARCKEEVPVQRGLGNFAASTPLVPPLPVCPTSAVQVPPCPVWIKGSHIPGQGRDLRNPWGWLFSRSEPAQPLTTIRQSTLCTNGVGVRVLWNKVTK